MNSEINEVQISIIILIIILLIKYNNELEETLNISYQTEQEDSNILPLIRAPEYTDRNLIVQIR